MDTGLEDNKELTQCYNCDAEFRVFSLFDEESDDMAVVFCPFCGEELDGMSEEWEEEHWDDLPE